VTTYTRVILKQIANRPYIKVNALMQYLHIMQWDIAVIAVRPLHAYRPIFNSLT